MTDSREPAEGEALRQINLATIRRMVDALTRADGPGIALLLTDDVLYHFPGRSPLSGTYKGRDEVMGLFRSVAALLGAPPTLHSHDVVASEAHVVELAIHSAERAGVPFEWSAIRVYHLRDGLVSEIWLMIGDQYAFDAYLA